MNHRLYYILTLFLLIQTSQQTCHLRRKRPHIIVIMGDDIGHNDISLRGSNQIPTPNIDALGYNGVILEKYYVQNSCTPSRAAFLTGNYPIRSGMQGVPIVAGQNKALPLNMKIMPQYLKKLGYKTHIVGKWHLGSAYRKNTPTQKGFDTHFGYWNGFVSYFHYVTNFNDTKIEGFDLHDKFQTGWGSYGKYATTAFTNRALDIINEHDTKKPMFLLVTHLAAHAGKDGTQLGVPNVTATNIKYGYIEEERRRLYTGIVTELDKSVGHIVKRLSQRKMLENSIILFYSDNGAPTLGPYGNSGSNWPLRGIKLTNFEGGVRGTAVLYAPKLLKKGYVNSELIHVSDWLPTFYYAAGGNLKDLGLIDGVNQWNTLSKANPSLRSEILVNINEVENTTAIITDNGRYKLITGNFENGTFNGYYGESGLTARVPKYNTNAVINSDTNIAIQKISNKELNPKEMLNIRNRISLVGCRSDNLTTVLDCSGGCLFNLEIDPCETTNIIEENPRLAARLLERINSFSKVLVPQATPAIDPRSNPQRYNNTWCTWLDDDWCVKTFTTTNI